MADAPPIPAHCRRHRTRRRAVAERGNRPSAVYPYDIPFDQQHSRAPMPGQAFVKNGRVALRLKPFERRGVKTVAVRYRGNDNVKASSSPFRVRVVHA